MWKLLKARVKTSQIFLINFWMRLDFFDPLGVKYGSAILHIYIDKNLRSLFNLRSVLEQI